MKTPSGTHLQNYKVPPSLKGPELPSPISGTFPQPTDFLNQIPARGIIYHTPSMSWSGTSCGSTSIGSSPPLPMDHAPSSFTPPFTHQSIPCSPSEKQSTESSIKRSQTRYDHVSDPFITDYDSNRFNRDYRKSSRIPTTPTRSPSHTFAFQGSGLHPFIQKIILTPHFLRLS